MKEADAMGEVDEPAVEAGVGVEKLEEGPGILLMPSSSLCTTLGRL